MNLNHRLLRGLLLIPVLIVSTCAYAQLIEKKEKITIPAPPATSQVFTSGQNITYRSWQEIEILPETDVQQGAELSFEVLGLGTPPSNPDANLNMNWILSRTFDASGNIKGEGKLFFNGKGLLLQTQTRNISTGHVLASQVIYDQLERPVINTMSAPTMNAAFNYKSDFVTNASGTAYNYANFDVSNLNTPEAVGNVTPGTLGWYYSNNNTIEAYVDATGYPYTRTDFYSDGTGAVKRGAGVGDALRMGNGHESSSYEMPVINELSHYLQVRTKFFPVAEMGANPSSLLNGAVQTIVRDNNGKEVVSISDRDGRVLMTAYPGTGGLSISNSVTLTASTAITNTSPAIHYFKLLSPSVVNISGSFALYNMSGNEAQMTFTSGGTLAIGYYKVQAVSGSVTLSYANNYTDINYKFYNQLGQLVAAISPEGVKKLLGTGINNYSSKTALPFTILNEYDLRGHLRSNITPDGGKVEHVYRSDGKIRFSQNTEQAQLPTKPYSYTNYDVLGRPIENGEFTPAAGGIAFNINGMANVESIAPDGALGAGTKADWVKTTYDVPVSTGLAGYVQNDVFLGAEVSYTENAAGAKTWYNYDELGRLTWLVQQLPNIGTDLGKKTIDYTYDDQNKVVKAIYQKATPGETFVHYYEYGSDEELTAVYTNTIDNPATKVLQAKYYYYLHGPVKRVELGNGVQGLDYTYTAEGWLKTINNGNRDQDPGKDGLGGINAAFAKDAFGMNLEYYSGDYSRANTGIGSIPLSSTIADDQYSGIVKGMSWHSRKPQSVLASLGATIENPTMYGFKYDNNYQLNLATWGAPNYSTPGFTASSAFKEYNLTYDAHGNIKSLARTGESGAVSDNFTYNYQPETNKLTSVANGTSTYASYTHNDLGQLTVETPGAGAARYLKYDVNGRVIGIYSDVALTQEKVSFVYNERGQRILKKDAVNNLTTYYVPDANGTILAIYTKSGDAPAIQSELPIYADKRIGLYRRPAGLYEYELSDHVGTVRVVIDQNRNIKQYGDFYPFGYELRRGGSTDYRYGYQGQYSEKDKETGWNAFELRMYDSRIARWLTTDPMAQYYSPYVGMGNDPVNLVDEDGDIALPEVVVKGRAVSIWEVFYSRMGKGVNPFLGLTESRRQEMENWLDREVERASRYDKENGGTYKSYVLASAIPAAAQSARSGGIPGAVVGAGVIAGAVVLESEKVSKKTFITYTLINPVLGRVYVGRSSGEGDPQSIMQARYAGHHMRGIGYHDPKLDRWGKGEAGRLAIRGREQDGIDYYKDRNMSGNMINGISLWNPFRLLYLQSSKTMFGTFQGRGN